MRFDIKIKEISLRTVIVDADDINEALEKVFHAVQSGTIYLDEEDFVDRVINPSEYWPDGAIPDTEDVSIFYHL